MAFDLRILFQGLCVFVPNADEAKGARVLMVDARAPGLASNGRAQVSHIPSVRFALPDLAADRRQPAFRIDYSSQEPVPRGQWILNGDDLEIRCNGAPRAATPLKVLRAHPSRDFSLIPSMLTIYPETSGIEVREECLRSDLRTLADAGIAGRLRLDGGVLGAWDGSGGRFISVDEYMFTHDPQRHRQRLASRSFFETRIECDEVELYSRQRGHGLSFRPSNGERVEILIENEPPAELMASRPSDGDADYDFELVYLVAKDPPRPLRVPIRAAAAWESAAVAATHPAHAPAAGSPSVEAGDVPGHPICTPAAYNPSTEAGDVPGHPICTPAAYNPSTEAGDIPGHPACTPAAYNPSPEA